MSRYCSILLEGRSFVDTFGRIHFSKKILQPQLSKPAEASKPQAAQPKAKEAGAKAQQASKKEAAAAQVTTNALPKEETWEDKLPPINENFSLFDFKTLIVNHKDKREALKTLWKNWDDKAFSFYFVHYQKCEGENELTHHTKNYLNGFIQRIDDKLRKHSLCILGVYGDEPSLEVMGVMFWRGTDIIEPMKEHPQFEFWDKRKLNIAGSVADREIVERFWAIKEEEAMPNPLQENPKSLICQTKKYFK